MNTNLVFLILMMLSFNINPVNAQAAETKKVCVDQKQKDGKSKQVCKDIKVHKKLEGTAIPSQKK